MSNEMMQGRYEDHLAECHNRLAKVEKERDELLDVTIPLCIFVKTNDYPVKDSSEFMILTEYLDRLETVLRKMGMITTAALREAGRGSDE